MAVPQKPWSFGDKCCMICCTISGLLFALELVKGKDELTCWPAKEYWHLGKTFGPLLCPTKFHVALCKNCHTGQWLLHVRRDSWNAKKGVFALALMKKRHYWPKCIDGNAIATHFADKDIGTVDALPGHVKDSSFHIHRMKEADCTETGKQQSCNIWNARVDFQCPEVVHNHCACWDAVDNHNECRMWPIAIEESDKMTRWGQCECTKVSNSPQQFWQWDNGQNAPLSSLNTALFLSFVEMA